MNKLFKKKKEHTLFQEKLIKNKKERILQAHRWRKRRRRKGGGEEGEEEERGRWGGEEEERGKSRFYFKGEILGWPVLFPPSQATKWQWRNASKVLSKRKCDARILYSAKLYSSIKTTETFSNAENIAFMSHSLKNLTMIKPTKSLKTTQEWRVMVKVLLMSHKSV